TKGPELWWLGSEGRRCKLWIGMAVRPADTSADAWARTEEAIRQMTPAQRVQRAASLTVLAHRMALAHLRREYPEDSERTLKLRLAARYIDPATMKAAFGWPHD